MSAQALHAIEHFETSDHKVAALKRAGTNEEEHAMSLSNMNKALIAGLIGGLLGPVPVFADTGDDTVIDDVFLESGTFRPGKGAGRSRRRQQ